MLRCLTIACVLISLSCSAQKELLNYVNVWNFIKYYHPDLATGKIDADSLFLAHIPTEKENFNDVVNSLTKDLTNIQNAKPIPEHTKDILTQNQNFNWFQKSKTLSKANKKRLTEIYNNRYTQIPHHYVPERGYSSDLPNEKDYPTTDQENLPRDLRLLAMAKIWGAIDYLYPHQYLMPKDAELKFEKLLQQSFSAESKRDFEEILAKTVALFEDTHAFRFYNQLKYKAEIFHTRYYPPFDYRIVNDYLLITHMVDQKAAEKAHLALGDRIYSINGKSIPTLIAEKKERLSISNAEGLRFRLSDYQNNLIWSDDVLVKTLKIQKKNEKKTFLNTSVHMLNPKEQADLEMLTSYLKSKIQRKQKQQLEDPDAAYFRIDQTFKYIADVEDDEIDKTMKQIRDDAASKKAIIFDMRGYPDWGGFVYHYIYAYFSPKENHFGKYYQQNLKNIGTFTYHTDSKTYFPEVERMNTSYKGKVFIIVDPETLSASEWNTMNLQHIFPQAITIGQQTAGADGDIKKLKLPGGYLLEFTGNAIFYPNGKQTQKVGVKVDKTFHYRDEDILSGKDAVFEWIRSELKK